MSEKTIPELVASRLKKHGTRLLFQRRDGWSWKQITWLDFDREVKNIASFLMDTGFQSSDRVIIASSNNLDAIATEIAVYHLGGVVAPLPQDEDLDTIIGSANELGAKNVFIENEALVHDLVERAKEATGVEKIVFYPDVRIKHEPIVNFKLVLKSGLMKRKKLHDDLVKVSQCVDSDNLAGIFMKSDGSGVTEVTQGAILDILSGLGERYTQIGIEDQSFSYMTEASPFSKFINYSTLYMGTRAAVAESREDFYEDILEVMPTILFETSDGLHAIYERSMSALNGSSPTKKFRSDLGERIRYIFTDSLPGDDVHNLFRSSGVEIFVVPELNDLAT